MPIKVNPIIPRNNKVTFSRPSSRKMNPPKAVNNNKRIIVIIMVGVELKYELICMPIY